MYTDTQEALRNSLWNFMGSMLTASAYEDKRKKESVTALVSEELCKFCKGEDQSSVDIQTAKPILKAALWVLESRKSEIEKKANHIRESGARTPIQPVLKALADITDLIEALKTYTDKI